MKAVDTRSILDIKFRLTFLGFRFCRTKHKRVTRDDSVKAGPRFPAQILHQLWWEVNSPLVVHLLAYAAIQLPHQLHGDITLRPLLISVGIFVLGAYYNRYGR